MKKAFLFAAVGAVTVLAGCANEPDEYEVKDYTSMANPAAVYCVQQGGELETVTENNERTTYCVFSEDDKIEQWEYYRNNHKQEEQTEQ
ncbi:putative hemolysin [Vibrio sp. TRT 21S02]|uniref:putative hemolysin n=1 Tax=Vibrio sp. TRT 21S02 TaxID=3418507 RepID=UPI003CF71D56